MPENKKPQNPSAFPAWDMTFGKNPNTNLYSAGTGQGMTLRDYFANSAMKGMVSNNGMYDLISMPAIENLAKESYIIADAMLKQRER